MPDDLRTILLTKIKTLNDTIWEDRIRASVLERWLSNFRGATASVEEERLHALYIASHFIYFGNRQIRELIRALYRDLFRYPIVRSIRERHAHTTDLTLIEAEFEAELSLSLFFGMGNPSESGSHLLYYFRQENGLSRDRFAYPHEIFERVVAGSQQVGQAVPPIDGLRVRSPAIRRYVFLDDLCASGEQGVEYSRDVVAALKLSQPDVHVAYYALVATAKGLKNIRENTLFDDVQCILELDESFRCFDADSRYFQGAPVGISKATARKIFEEYGCCLVPAAHALGFADGQLLLGFHHNTPDNTLTGFWFDGSGSGVVDSWSPLFHRYIK